MGLAGILATHARIRTGTQAALLVIRHVSIDEIAFEIVVRAFFAVEEIILAENPQAGGDGSIAQGQDVGRRVRFSSFNAQALRLQPRHKLLLLLMPRAVRDGIGGEEKGLGVFSLEGMGKAVLAQPGRADNDGFSPGIAFF